MIKMITVVIGFLMLAMHFLPQVNGQNVTAQNFNDSATNASSSVNITKSPAVSGNASNNGSDSANMTTVPKFVSTNMPNPTTNSPVVTTTTVTMTTTTVTVTPEVSATPQLPQTGKVPLPKSAGVSLQSSGVTFVLVGWLIRSCFVMARQH